MGHNIIAQARGRGGPRYRTPSFRFYGRAEHFSGEGIITDIVKDPGHSAPLAVVKAVDGEHLLIAPEGICVGQAVKSAPDAEPVIGNTLPLRNIPEGTVVCNIETIPGDGGKFVRSSGGFARVLGMQRNQVLVLLPSKKQHAFHPDCRATVGSVAGSGRKEKPFYKAGRVHHHRKARNKLYPHVSGTSMNAVDHPYGGRSSAHKGHPMTTSRNAPPGRKVGRIAARRTGKKR